VISPAQLWRAAVVGATGYAGAELVRFLLKHPMVQLACVASTSRAGQPLASVHPGLEGFTDLVFDPVDPSKLATYDVVFLAVPHGAATDLAAALDAAGARSIVDLSADHRHADGWVYGQAEWHADALYGSNRVAVPGCFATAISVALAPFVASGAITGPVPCVAATGSTGSGATPKATTHHPERMVDLKAYKVLSHQHTPEVEAFLRGLGPFEGLKFVPLSAPLDRGILATCFVRLPHPDIDPFDVVADAYAERRSIRVRRTSPHVRHVRGTGLCDLSVHRDGDLAVVLSAIDNLGKGAAAHAVQGFNLSVGMAVDTGLGATPCLP